MLIELEVRDFAIIDHIRCAMAPGFNVLTGETGAGKSIVVGALGQLLGERADTSLVRSGCSRAVVSGVFDPGPAAPQVKAILDDHGIDEETELILGREIHAAGRSTARVNGRAVPAKTLAEIGALLVDVHGQSESASLKREAAHLELLDRYADIVPLRSVVATLVGQLRAVDAELSDLQADEAALARRADLLAFQVDEIAAAELSEQEETELLSERTRLANAESLALLADRAYAALRDESGERLAALDLLDQAIGALGELAHIDEGMAEPLSIVTRSADSLAEQASVLRSYRDSLAFDPERLDEVEQRLAAISDLKRKYGPDIAAVISFGERSAAELGRLRSSEERIGELDLRREALLVEIGGRASEVSERRREAGSELARQVESEMAELNMSGGRFEVDVRQESDPDGAPVDDARLAFDATGIDRVAFLVSTNPGEPPRPLVRVASGGETARLMLGLKTVLTAADQVPCLVFDEIDAGIGGRVGAVVGRKLWGLAARHQVLCVTHLPQVAAYGDTHLQVRKTVVDGRTVTEIEDIGPSEQTRELAQMLGGASDAALGNAAELLEESGQWKAKTRGGA